MDRTIGAALAFVLVALVAIGVVTGGGDDPAPERRAERPVPRSVAEVAREVEGLRRLSFDRMPRVERMSPDEAERHTMRIVRRVLPESVLTSGEDALKVLGLLGSDDDLGELYSDVIETETAGFYDPYADRLVLIEGNSGGGQLAEVVLAHELVHALEDQRFDLRALGEIQAIDDGALAEAAVQEGTATIVMLDYLGAPRGVALEELAGAVAELGGMDLPRYLEESLVFPYMAGAQLVDHLERGGGWEAVNAALRELPPQSTEQVMHPDKYDSREEPRRVRLGRFRQLLPERARRAAGGALGEFDTLQLLLEGAEEEDAERGAAGWGGSRFELWQWDAEERLEGTALVAAWAWDSDRDAAEFVRVARGWLEALPHDTAVTRSGAEVVVALTPRGTSARRVVAAAAR